MNPPRAAREGDANPPGPYALKEAVFGDIAAIARSLASPSRLLVLEVIAQGEVHVERIAQATGLTVANTSQHLRALRQAGLIRRERNRQFVYHRLANDGVVRLLASLHGLALQLSPALEKSLRAYRDRLGALEPVGAEELLARSRAGLVTIVDTRPEAEYRLGHPPGAINLPLAELDTRMGGLAPGTEVVAYCRGVLCLLASEAVARMRAAGVAARRLEYGFPEWRAAGFPVDHPRQ